MISFYYLLLLHFIGDFLMQDRHTAENKSKSFSVMHEHCFDVLLIYLVGLFLIGKNIHNIDGFLIFIYCTHFLQDTLIWRGYKYFISKTSEYKTAIFYKKEYRYWEKSHFYHAIGFDQMLHIATLYLLWKVLL